MGRKPRQADVPQRARRAAVATPPEFGGDPVVWAAWLYYEESLNQEEVAERLGISRATVVNFLQEARDRGIVTIAVATERLGQVALAHALARRYGLDGCYVVPDDGGRRPDYERVGRAGARLLAERLKADDILGVSWGRTVLSLSTAVPPLSLPHVSVVQVTGSAIGNYAFSPELCTSNIASRIGGRCVNLHAPGIVSRPEVKAILMAEPSLVEQFALIRACTKFVFGVTNVEASSMAFGSGYLTPDKSRPYVERGAVGVLFGRFFDAAGRPVHGELDDSMIGLEIEEIAAIPERICVAAGLDKVAAIHGMLTGGHATLFVTDEPTARALTAIEEERPRLVAG